MRVRLICVLSASKRMLGTSHRVTRMTPRNLVIDLHWMIRCQQCCKARDQWTVQSIDWARLNVPPNTLQVISGTIFTGHMTKPTVSKHWRKRQFRDIVKT